MKHRRLTFILLAVPIILLVPLIAMQLTEEVAWTSFDFVVMGIMLLATGLLCELAIRKVTRTKHRIALCIAITGVFLIVWAELAVGIFGTPFAGS